MNDEGYLKRDPRLIALVETGGARAAVFTPLLKDNEVIGILVLFRQEVGPFTDKQIALVQNFAAQAVIAIENTRLLNELRQRTTDLTESLEQQTATSEVLRVISSSPGALEPVFDAMLENATRICDAAFGDLYLRAGDGFCMAATHNSPAAYAAARKSVGVLRPPSDAPLGHVAITKRPVQIDDIRKIPSYSAGDPFVCAGVELARYRTVLAVPMIKDHELIGCITICRQEVRPFSDKQIGLVTNFANQAVIAIENTRLLNELRESLQQQTATSEVLGAISGSPSDLGPVFQTVLTNATQLCEAAFGLLLFYEGDWRFRGVASCNVPPAFAELRQREPIFEAGPQTGLGRAVATKDVVHIVDYAQEPVYKEQRHPAAVALYELGGGRTFLVVPMLKEKEVAGVIAIYRQQVRPFADKQIELVKSFASQAVIAIENARLLNELRQSLQQQTATADVLKVISRSTFDLQTVLTTLLQSAATLCGADRAALTREVGGTFQHVASYGYSAEYQEYMEKYAIPSGPCLDERSLNAKSFTFRMFGPIQSMSSVIRNLMCAPHWASHSFGKAHPLA
jgi:GAF domain-containing protein